MGNNGDDRKCVFPLKSLQIGEFKSYVSDLSIVMSNKHKKLYILVDHQPWINATHLWKSILLKTRLCPFANRKHRYETVKQKQDHKKLKKKLLKKNSLKEILQITSLYLTRELHKNLYGLIVFEVEWRNVRGIHYLNELQTHTSLAIEAKLMRRWEFQSINQARTNRSRWFSGSKSETSCLIEYLGFHSMKKSHKGEDYEIVEASEVYEDSLIVIKFDDLYLPYKLEQIIMNEKNLITLLEAGIPTWVLFVQSYPGLSYLYKPWLCLLGRSLYVIISIITVVIGFYDLYKNVPLLKATAASLCGPFFQWVETLDMISRIKYLGTMLFLHQIQKAINWTLTITSTMKSLVSVLLMPLSKPSLKVLGLLLPLWNSTAQILIKLVSVVWIVIEPCISLVGDVVDLLLLPFVFVISLVSKLIRIIWKVVYAPIRVVSALAKCLIFPFLYMFKVLGNLWRNTKRILKISSDSKRVEVSIWRGLWNDLFSHVFRALRSIVNGFVAFFAACNRHRLSIYNYVQDFIKRLHGRVSKSESIHSRRGRSARNHRRSS